MILLSYHAYCTDPHFFKARGLTKSTATASTQYGSQAMRCTLLALFFGASILGTAVNAASVLHRQERQIWTFPDDPAISVNIPVRPDTSSWRTSRPTTEVTSSTTTPRPGGSTSIKPDGVIFQVKNCNCLAPPQFNPVCGTDGNTYVNRQRLDCTRRCGYDVQEVRMGSC